MLFDENRIFAACLSVGDDSLNRFLFIYLFFNGLSQILTFFRLFIRLQNLRENSDCGPIFQNRKVFYFIRLPVLFETNACFPCSVRPFYLPIPDLSVSETVVSTLF